MIVEKIIGDARDFQGEDLKIDKVYLDYLGMGKPHQKLTAESGEKFSISLKSELETTMKKRPSSTQICV